jgi:thioester reductase-like protein
MSDTVPPLPYSKRKHLVRLLQQRLTVARSALEQGSKPANIFESFAIPVTNLKSETELDPSIHFDVPEVDTGSEPTRVLLTGATGFLGSFLLFDLLRQTRSDVYCLVRCSDVEQGRTRIHRSLQHYTAVDSYESSRIIPVQGDVSKPRLGLSAWEFERLAANVDAIYHNAAVVNWLYTYAQLRPTNVLGTLEVIRLASLFKLKPLHYISTVAACPLEDTFEVTVVNEQPLVKDAGVLYGGYPQSKWVAEQLVLRAQSLGLMVRIYRPGIITGHSQTGAWNTTDATCRMIKLAVEAGVTPDLDAAVDMTPVDYVSSAIVYLAKLSRPSGTIYHLANPSPVDAGDLVSWIRAFGYPLRRIPYETWRSELMTLARGGQKNALSSFTPLFSKVVSNKIPGWTRKTLATWYQSTMDRVIGEVGALYGARSVQLDCRAAARDLAGTSIVCPPVSDRLLNTYLRYFVRVGFIDAPAHPPL